MESSMAAFLSRKSACEILSKMLGQAGWSQLCLMIAPSLGVLGATRLGQRAQPVRPRLKRNYKYASSYMHRLHAKTLTYHMLNYVSNIPLNYM